MSIRIKIAVAFALMTAIFLLMLTSFVYFVSLQHTHGYFFTRLKVRASITAESEFEKNEARSSNVKEIRERHLQFLPREEEFFFANNATALKRVRQSHPEIPLSFFEEVKKQGEATYNIGFNHYAGVLHSSAGGEYIVIAKAYDEEGEDHMDYLLNLLLLGFSVSCLIAFIIGRIFAHRIMQPISTIITKVQHITVSNLHERLPTRDSNDEMNEMASTFNTMFDRLETTFELQSNFIGNASHELRTPLTAILGEAEIILKSPRNAEDYVASIRTMQHEAKRLDDVTTSLLNLSQISFDGKKQKIEPELMDEVLLSIKIGFDKRMPENRITLLVQPIEDNIETFLLPCVRPWMELALTNIIQNSIKYSDNNEVLVTLEADPQNFFIHISDYGIGIPTEEIRHIFEPFFRASNTGKYTGYGIGLPLAERIIRLHGGKMNIQSRPQAGTKVSLIFKRTQD
jgi:signal transduction histidine kinase